MTCPSTSARSTAPDVQLCTYVPGPVKLTVLAHHQVDSLDNINKRLVLAVFHVRASP